MTYLKSFMFYIGSYDEYRLQRKPQNFTSSDGAGYHWSKSRYSTGPENETFEMLPCFLTRGLYGSSKTMKVLKFPFFEN